MRWAVKLMQIYIAIYIKKLFGNTCALYNFKNWAIKHLNNKTNQIKQSETIKQIKLNDPNSDLQQIYMTNHKKINENFFAFNAKKLFSNDLVNDVLFKINLHIAILSIKLLDLNNLRHANQTLNIYIKCVSSFWSRLSLIQNF